MAVTTATLMACNSSVMIAGMCGERMIPMPPVTVRIKWQEAHGGMGAAVRLLPIET